MSPARNFLFLIFFAGALALTGCGRPVEKTVSLSVAEKRLASICQDEYKLTPVIKPLQNTVWVYLGVQEPFFDYKADSNPEKPAGQPKETRNINFLDARFDGRALLIDFDITPGKQYPKNPGYKSSYSEKFQADQRNLLTGIVRAYGDVAESGRPKFFVVVIADILKGLELKMTLCFADLLRGTTDPSFYEEYSRRLLYDDLIGGTEIIDDAAGKHLKPSEVTWPEFLAKQIPYRVRYQYQRSDFPPKDSDVNEILKVVHETVSAYDFKDFDGVKVTDLQAKKEYDFRKEQLSAFSQ